MKRSWLNASLWQYDSKTVSCGPNDIDRFLLDTNFVSSYLYFRNNHSLLSIFSSTRLSSARKWMDYISLRK